MRNKSKSIPENKFPSGVREGIYIARTSADGLTDTQEVGRAHRDNGHIFILQEKGKTHIEVDFQTHKIKQAGLLYIHPSQVHRLIGFENATIASWIITNENLHPQFLKILESLAPVNVITLADDTLNLISATASLCIDFSQRTHEKLYEPLLKESLNTLIALVASQFIASKPATGASSRFELITADFKALLETNFTAIKSPGVYAERLNISTSYLNECVRNATGHSVSYHIQQRVILEAKRLLVHTERSIKEIGGELGYSDFNYFTRLFNKAADMSPLAFRNKNLD